MALRRPGDKPLSESMIFKFIDAYMRHSAAMSYQFMCEGQNTLLHYSALSYSSSHMLTLQWGPVRVG